MIQSEWRRPRRADGLLAGLAFALTAAGVALGGGPSAVALTASAVAVLVSLVVGHVPGRGSAVAGLALLLGSTLIGRNPGAVPWGDLALLGLMVTSAAVGTAMADRLSPRPAEASTDAAGWMTVVVALEGPADVAGTTARLPVTPIRGPERRRRERLTRRDRVMVENGAALARGESGRCS